MRVVIPGAQSIDLRSLIDEAISRTGGVLAARIGGSLADIVVLVFQLFVTLFALFFFLRDANAIMRHVRRALPFGDLRHCFVGSAAEGTGRMHHAMTFSAACVRPSDSIQSSFAKRGERDAARRIVNRMVSAGRLRELQRGVDTVSRAECIWPFINAARAQGAGATFRHNAPHERCSIALLYVNENL